jgi:hypothetical protein
MSHPEEDRRHRHRSIVVTHENERRRIVAAAEGAHQLASFQGLPGLEGALGRRLIASPSAIGSVKGIPNSMTAPAAGSACTRASDVSGSGSPAVRNVTTRRGLPSSAPQSADRYAWLWVTIYLFDAFSWAGLSFSLTHRRKADIDGARSILRTFR